MKRKVNRVGQNTLTVSLPADWVRKQGIKVGDVLNLEEEGRGLCILKEEGRNKVLKAVLNIDDFNRMMLNRYVHEFYRQGVEEIVLNFKRPKFPDYKNGVDIDVGKYVNKLVERFIGMEIISQTQNKIILQSLISREECEKIGIVQKRIYFLIKEFFDEFINAMGADFNKFHALSYDYHDNIAKFTLYYLRLLHFSDIPDEKKARLFGLFMVIDKMIDKVRHTGEMVVGMKKVTPKVCTYVKNIFYLFL
ncbi:MAG: AbrB/MazE/SpoVT family DNA-binding domain-containing protein [Candidatus Woesearchaeota archaeon]